MKKNLMSILILALLVVNVALTAIMMFSVTGAMKSTTALVGKIAAVLDLELNLDKDENAVAIEDSVTYDIADTMTIPLQIDETEEDAGQHYAMIQVSLQMDKSNKDYKSYSETLATNESIIKGEIIEVVSSHTLAEFRNDTDGVRREILARIQRMYGSDFIYKVVFRDWKVQ